MELLLNIAGLNIKISNYPFSETAYQLQPFLIKNMSVSENPSYIFTDIPTQEPLPDFYYTVGTYSGTYVLSGDCIVDQGIYKVYQEQDKIIMRTTFGTLSENNICYTIFQKGTNQAQIYIPDFFLKQYQAKQLFLTLLWIDLLLLRFDESSCTHSL